LYKNGLGHIHSHYHPTKVDFMFNKKIKLLVSSYADEIFLVTENGEVYKEFISRRKYLKAV